MNWDRRIKSSDLEDNLFRILRSLKDGPVFIERYSEVIAVLVSYEDWEKINPPQEGRHSNA